MRLLGYTRVSTEEQAENGHSLSLQVLALEAFCKAHSHELLHTYSDAGVSASMPLAKRKGGARLMQDLEQGRAEGVLVTATDRLFRLGLDAANVGAYLREQGLPLLATQERVDILDDDGWLLFWLKAGLAERERLKIVRRAVETSTGLKSAGQAYGPTPFGLVNVDGKLFRHPQIWAVREEIMRMRNQRRLSWKGICLELEAQDVANPSGGVRWHESTVQRINETHHGLKHIPALPKVHEGQFSAGGGK